MESLSLTPATQAVLDALTELGRGNVHELADKSGKARSTTDKAIKTLADAGVIVAVDTDADPADGTPTQWTLAPRAEDPDAAPDDVDLGDERAGITDEADFGDPDLDDAADEPDTGDTERTDQPDDGEGGTIPDDAGADTEDEAGQTEDGDEDAVDDDSTRDDESRTLTVVQAPRPGDRKVMAIKGVLADYGDDGATLDVIVAESGIGHPTATRLLTAMEQADAARRLPGATQRWIPGPTKASDVDPNPQPPRCPLCHQVIRRLANTPSATAAVLPLIRPDGTLHVVGPDGETHVVTLPTRTRATGLGRSVGRRGDGTVNTDGSQPFGRGELEKLTLDVLAANPGRAMTPQDIATAIGGQLGRTVSSGAVRNNCTKAAAAGRILLVSDAPLTFAHPTPADDGTASEQS
ncbi:helix-turn-helix domain-containing protein [Micromonospora chersina]|uniref:MarR family winged helix-turn-helix transcriptional regulator n=1 Tax=Micromonospora chersina TaxID=47854 RepID=UPI00340AD75C